MHTSLWCLVSFSEGHGYHANVHESPQRCRGITRPPMRNTTRPGQASRTTERDPQAVGTTRDRHVSPVGSHRCQCSHDGFGSHRCQCFTRTLSGDSGKPGFSQTFQPFSTRMGGRLVIHTHIPGVDTVKKETPPCTPPPNEHGRAGR